MTNFEKIILSAVGVLFIVVLIIGAIVSRQQKIINTYMKKAVTPSVQTPAKRNVSALQKGISQFFGTIKSLSGNQMTIDAKLTDFSRPKTPDKLKNASSPVNLSADDFEVLEKKITVNTNDKTIFEKKNLAELKVGDIISVSADKSPYPSDSVMAEKIIAP